ncbi:MAG: PhoH family protein [bacterium]|nr:PhoH family protein [bacterium]
MMYEQTITLANAEEALGLFGQQDVNLRLIRDEFRDVTLIPRGTELIIHGEHPRVDTVKKLIDDLISILHSGHVVRIPEIKYALKMISQNREVNLPGLFKEVICVSERGRIIKPKTMGQKRYIESIKTNDIVFGIGPAGTGKTYLAVAMAVSELIRKKVVRIILTRPAIEAGERLGFLPGDLQEKIDPYLRPLYDALYDMMGIERVQHLLSEGIIEVAPLAFMRGRTLNDAFIILDEAQNTTSEQMKMFLTRLGFDSKTIITGDVTQIDLPKNTTSGLVEVQSVIKNIPGIEFVYFTECDVVRHELVSEVIKAYEAYKRRDNSVME